MDPALRAQRRATLRLIEERAEVRMAPALRKAVYRAETSVYVTMYVSPTGIGWVVSQEDKAGMRYPIRFSAKVLSEWQQGYVKVNHDLWGIVLGPTSIRTI